MLKVIPAVVAKTLPVYREERLIVIYIEVLRCVPREGERLYELVIRANVSAPRAGSIGARGIRSCPLSALGRAFFESNATPR